MKTKCEHEPNWPLCFKPENHRSMTREQKLEQRNRDLILAIIEIRTYLTQRVLNMTEFNSLLMKINKTLRDAGEP